MFKWFLSDKTVERKYLEAGACFGDAVSYMPMGMECADFVARFFRWAKWEAEYSRRGFRAIPLNDFVAYGGYGTPLKGVGVKREEGEDAVLHAPDYGEIYFEDV